MIIDKELVNDLITALQHGAWGNYMARHYLFGISIDDLADCKDHLPRLLKEAEHNESECVLLSKRLYTLLKKENPC